MTLSAIHGEGCGAFFSPQGRWRVIQTKAKSYKHSPENLSPKNADRYGDFFFLGHSSR